MKNYERLGVFYLGKEYDYQADTVADDLLLYDSKDLTTHAVCVGMTGSGKTGLCVTLLEEAAIDGIPAIVIDPKGDLGNLMLTFPELKPGDFRPWVDPGEAQRKGLSPDEFAANRAALWREGLKQWEQDGERIAMLRRAVDIAIYTPGGTAGLGLTALRAMTAPNAALLEDQEAFRGRVATAVSGLLTLLGIDADPIQSREHIFLSNIIDRAWREKKDLDIASLIRQVQSPPFEKLGVLDLETFYPAADRFKLSMLLNNLLASPQFAAWAEGEPLDINRLLYGDDGRPRLAIISIAHLSDAERMFFVTVLLNEVVSWMRTQPGTSSLRAILYMDEIFGYFPPTANPPSKIPMLTLLKQARAYGLGVVLATQNPVDLDYKGLSNTGTWFVGRLQAERDKMRLLDGLEGAAAATGSNFKREDMDTLISGLASRVFLMNNVHDDRPMLFHTRWAMSYLRGPLTREHIKTLMASRKAAPNAPAAKAAAPVVAVRPSKLAEVATVESQVPPALPPGVPCRFIAIARAVPADSQLIYQPALVGVAKLHYVRSSANIDRWVDVSGFTILDDDTVRDPWRDAEELDASSPAWGSAPDGRGRFAALPSAAARASSFTKWSKGLASHLYQRKAATILKCPSLKEYSTLNESEGEFRVRLRQVLHEKRDLALEKLRKRFAPKLQRLQDRIGRAEEKVDRENSQMKQQGLQTAISFGSTLLGALFGRKKTSVGNVTRAAGALRGASRTARERGDVRRAKENVEELQQRFAALEEEFDRACEEVRETMTVASLDFDEITLRPRKSDIVIESVCLAWTPFLATPHGTLTPACDL